MKKFTFLLSLLLASSGVTASAQDAFVASSAPSNGSWASDTKWYKMSLSGNYLSAYKTDHNGSLLDNSATVEGAGAYWCIVGDATNGYKFYNRAAGPNKVFGIVSALTNNDNDVTRASFYTSETVAASSEVGTTFDLGLYAETTSNEYHVKLHGDGNYYWNKRGKYLGYWNSTAATNKNETGSKVKFSAVDISEVEAADNASAEAFKTALSEKITAAKALLNDSKVGYYSQAAINKAQAVLDATTSTAADYYFAKIELKPNVPKAGVLYRIKSANSAFKTIKAIYHDGATTKWGNEDVTNASQYWFIEPYGSFCYKLQAIDSKLYLNSASQLSATPNYVEIASTPGLVNIRVSGAAMLHAAGHNGGQGNEGSVIAYEENPQIFGQEGGPSSWTIVEATVDEAKQMQVKGTPEKYEGGLLVGGFDPQNAEAFHQDMASSTTMEDVLNKINSELPVAGRALDVNKYYRLVCVSPKTGNKDANNNASDATYTTLTRGTKNVVTAPFSKGNVDQIWKFEKTDGGYYLKNMNGNGYLNNVRQGDARAKLVETPSDKFEMMEGSVSTQKALHVVGQIATACLFAENHPNEPTKGDAYAVAGWFQGSDYSNGAWAWKFVEADDIEVALNTVESKSYATAYLPFGVSAVSGAKAYTAAEPANGQTVMTETANFAKETGVLLVSDGAADKAVLTIGDVEGATNTSALKGTLLAKDITGAQTKYLVFGKNNANEKEVGFFEPSTAVTSIPANRAFFADTEGSAIALNFGNVTAVNNVVAGNANANAPIFDLTGRRVVKAVKGGLYIQNGKKYIVK
mgnify:CR=1 FL=1